MRQRIHELDGLRAIAILLVIGCHYDWFAAQLGGLPKLGWIGVDLFFVLSGFLITSILLHLRNTPHPLAYFYKRRCLRILPPLGLTLLAIATACLATGDHGFFSAKSIAKNCFFLQSFVDVRALLHPHLPNFRPAALPVAVSGVSGSMSSSAGVLWSLSIEEYFYLLWAPVVLWLRKRTVLGVALAICTLEFFVRIVFFTGESDYFSIFHRFDALIYGALIALLFDKLSNRSSILKWSLLISFVGLGLVFMMIRPVLGLEVRNSPLFVVFALPLISICAASSVGLLAIRTGSRNALSRFLRSQPVRTLGIISYTLYLAHLLVYLLVSRFIPSKMEAAVVSLIAAVGLSYLSWVYIEEPLLNRKSGRKSNRDLEPTKTPAVALSN